MKEIESVINYGAPKKVWLEYQVDGKEEEGRINITLFLFNKTATKLPEAMWLSFSPLTLFPNESWRMDKLGQFMDPL